MKSRTCWEAAVYGIACTVFVVVGWAACDALPRVVQWLSCGMSCASDGAR